MDHYDYLEYNDQMNKRQAKQEYLETEERMTSYDAIENLVEILMWSKNDIDKEMIATCLRVIANDQGFKDIQEIEADNLCVDHYKEKYIFEQRAIERYKPRLDRIEFNVRSLKQELCGTLSTNEDTINSCFSEICREVCVQPEKVNVKRKTNMEFVDFMMERQYGMIEYHQKIN